MKKVRAHHGDPVVMYHVLLFRENEFSLSNVENAGDCDETRVRYLRFMCFNFTVTSAATATAM